MELNLPLDVINHSLKELRRRGYLHASFSVMLNGQVGCRSCNWVGDMDECIVGKYTKMSISCPGCGAFCGELCKH